MVFTALLVTLLCLITSNSALIFEGPSLGLDIVPPQRIVCDELVLTAQSDGQPEEFAWSIADHMAFGRGLTVNVFGNSGSPQPVCSSVDEGSLDHAFDSTWPCGICHGKPFRATWTGLIVRPVAGEMRLRLLSPSPFTTTFRLDGVYVQFNEGFVLETGILELPAGKQQSIVIDYTENIGSYLSPGFDYPSFSTGYCLSSLSLYGQASFTVDSKLSLPADGSVILSHADAAWFRATFPAHIGFHTEFTYECVDQSQILGINTPGFIAFVISERSNDEEPIMDYETFLQPPSGYFRMAVVFNFVTKNVHLVRSNIVTMKRQIPTDVKSFTIDQMRSVHNVSITFDDGVVRAFHDSTDPIRFDGSVVPPDVDKLYVGVVAGPLWGLLSPPVPFAGFAVNSWRMAAVNEDDLALALPRIRLEWLTDCGKPLEECTYEVIPAEYFRRGPVAELVELVRSEESATLSVPTALLPKVHDLDFSVTALGQMGMPLGFASALIDWPVLEEAPLIVSFVGLPAENMEPLPHFEQASPLTFRSRLEWLECYGDGPRWVYYRWSSIALSEGIDDGSLPEGIDNRGPTLVVPAGGLGWGWRRVTLRVCLTANERLCASARYDFFIHRSVPIVRLNGLNRQLAVVSSVQFDASNTVIFGDTPAVFYWICEVLPDEAGVCPGEGWESSAVVQFDAGRLPVGKYMFTVYVSDINDGPAGSASGRLDITDSAVALPDFVVTPPVAVIHGQRLLLEARSPSGEDMSDWAFSWMVTGSDDGILFPVPSPLGSLTSRFLVEAGVLRGGVEYTFVCTATRPQDGHAAKGESRLQIVPTEVVVGILTASPDVGTALSTRFSFESEGLPGDAINFQFFYKLAGAAAELPLSPLAQLQRVDDVIFEEFDSEADNVTVVVTVYAFNLLGLCGRASTTVVVEPSLLGDASDAIGQLLDEAVDSQDVDSVHRGVVLLLSTLQSPGADPSELHALVDKALGALSDTIDLVTQTSPDFAESAGAALLAVAKAGVAGESQLLTTLALVQSVFADVDHVLGTQPFSTELNPLSEAVSGNLVGTISELYNAAFRAVVPTRKRSGPDDPALSMEMSQSLSVGLDTIADLHTAGRICGEPFVTPGTDSLQLIAGYKDPHTLSGQLLTLSHGVWRLPDHFFNESITGAECIRLRGFVLFRDPAPERPTVDFFTAGCSPVDCAAYNASCGEYVDGCGSTVHCGDCSDGSYCDQIEGFCVFIPPTTGTTGTTSTGTTAATTYSGCPASHNDRYSWNVWQSAAGPNGWNVDWRSAASPGAPAATSSTRNFSARGRNEVFVYSAVEPSSTTTTLFIAPSTASNPVPPDAAVTGVQITIVRRASAPGLEDEEFSLVFGGVVQGGSNRCFSGGAACRWPTNDPATVATIGSRTDLWGLAPGVLSAATVNPADFGLAIRTRNTGSAVVGALLDEMHFTIFYTSCIARATTGTTGTTSTGTTSTGTTSTGTTSTGTTGVATTAAPAPISGSVDKPVVVLSQVSTSLGWQSGLYPGGQQPVPLVPANDPSLESAGDNRLVSNVLAPGQTSSKLVMLSLATLNPVPVDAVITGVRVYFLRRANVSGLQDTTFSLHVRGQTLPATDRCPAAAACNWPEVDAGVASYLGGPGDLWGLDPGYLTSRNINENRFGVAILTKNIGRQPAQALLDQVYVQVYYTIAASSPSVRRSLARRQADETSGVIADDGVESGTTGAFYDGGSGGPGGFENNPLVNRTDAIASFVAYLRVGEDDRSVPVPAVGKRSVAYHPLDFSAGVTVVIELQHEVPPGYSVKCVYKEDVLQPYLHDDSCQLTELNATHATCTCYHLSAVAVQTAPTCVPLQCWDIIFRKSFVDCSAGPCFGELSGFQAGFQCTTFTDGCGGLISCGSCSPGGIPTQACTTQGCVPFSAPAATSLAASSCGDQCGFALFNSGGSTVCDCSAGTHCQKGRCVPCNVTCASAGVNCGSFSDPCGRVVQCAACATGSQCIDNRCVAVSASTSSSCLPLAACPLGACGAYPDGCGRSLNCGGCPGAQTCNRTSNKCTQGCLTCWDIFAAKHQPDSCPCYDAGQKFLSIYDLQCRTYTDRCGGTITCGTCNSGIDGTAQLSTTMDCVPGYGCVAPTSGYVALGCSQDCSNRCGLVLFPGCGSRNCSCASGLRCQRGFCVPDSGTPNYVAAFNNASGLFTLNTPASTRTVDFTVGFWVYMNAASRTLDQYLLYNGVSTTNGFGIRVSANQQNIVNFFYGGTGAPPALVMTRANLGSRRWVYFTASLSASGWTVYVNGTVVDTGLVVSRSMVVPATRFNLAGSQSAGTRGTAANLDGKLDKVQFWESVLPASQVLWSMTAELTGFESNLVLFIPFPDPSSTALTGPVGNGVVKGNLYITGAFKYELVPLGTAGNISSASPGPAGVVAELEPDVLPDSGHDTSIVSSTTSAAIAAAGIVAVLVALAVGLVVRHRRNKVDPKPPAAPTPRRSSAHVVDVDDASVQ